MTREGERETESHGDGRRERRRDPGKKDRETRSWLGCVCKYVSEEGERDRQRRTKVGKEERDTVHGSRERKRGVEREEHRERESKRQKGKCIQREHNPNRNICFQSRIQGMPKKPSEQDK